MPAEIISKYFQGLSELQLNQFSQLQALYEEWNAKINVISRKDIDNLYEHHVLHSLAIAKFMAFKDGTHILDIGTGGGFPGIPLAIMFPQCQFVLIDSIGKKIRVAMGVADAIGLKNVICKHENAKEEKGKFDFVVCRAVMNAADLVMLVKKNISPASKNSLPNGLICLKGGDLSEEGSLAMQSACMSEHYSQSFVIENVSSWFEEDYFESKKILYVPLIKQ